MNLTKAAYVVILRGVALALSLQGQDRAADVLYKLAAAVQLGMNIDDYMEIVAQQLEEGTEASWEDIDARVNKEVDEFLSRGSDGQLTG